jgi:hypothetical protein
MALRALRIKPPTATDQGEKPMLRVALAALVVATIATSALAQSTGVAICDDFLNKFETCINTKLPTAQRASFRDTLEQLRKSYLEMAKNAEDPAMRPLVEQTLDGLCKASLKSFNTALQVHGCRF